MRVPYLRGDNAALFTDLYELKMAQAYHAEGLTDRACFSLFFRKLPAARNYLLACGLQAVVEYLERLRFTEADLDYLAATGAFSASFLRYLEGFRFSGDVYAVPEGTPVFPQEPLLEVEAPIIEAQLIETWALNQLHAQTVLASKAARVVAAAAGRPVLDFGARRIHGADGALQAARAFHIAGVAATSNVLAGQHFGIPVAGTMAHSYVQAHERELDAFRAFVQEFPETVLLVDTYDTVTGIERVITLARELGDRFRVRGVRIDSGDLTALAREARRRFDGAGLQRLQIIVSGGLDEVAIAALVRAGAPVDGFGVGTDMGVSADAPALDMAYKLVAYAGRSRVKRSQGKQTLPGRKQVFRRGQDGVAGGDVLGRAGESLAGATPLLVPVMKGGHSLPAGRTAMRQARERAARLTAALPPRLRRLEPAEPAYPVELSAALQQHCRELAAERG